MNSLENRGPILDNTGVILMITYFVLLIAIGIAGRIARKENSMADFYLSGRNMGMLVLFLTLYATQYSGHTLIGFPGKAYRQGYIFIMSVTFMMAIVAAYFMYAPRLFVLSKREKFITIGNYVQYRFKSDTLTVLITISCIIALGNFILTNLKAIGYIVEISTGGVITFEMGIILLSLIMIIYETLGGMRSVAWTDAVQGILLLIGVITIFIVIQFQYGSLPEIAEKVKMSKPEFWMPPDMVQKNLWLSTIILFMFGVSVYPHAIQRIYSARNAKILKRSLQLMIFMPLVTTFFMFVVGIVGVTVFPGLSRQGSDEITLHLLRDIAGNIEGIDLLLVLFISAAVAAIMSTVDSALLAISSLFTEDLYKRYTSVKNEAALTMTGKIFSWIVMGIMAALAILLPETIWRLTEIKLELLCQIAPAIFLGINFERFGYREILAGFAAGTVVALMIMFLSYMDADFSAKPFGFHAGLWGLLVNMIIVIVYNKKITSNGYSK